MAVMRPSSTPAAVVVAFPWGAGTADLLQGMLNAYWSSATLSGVAVVGVQLYGPSLSDDAEEVMAAVLEWVGREMPGTPQRVVLAGASAGGVGVFHAALGAPKKVGGIIAMPGRYSGDAALDVLTGVPIWMMVGEEDVAWLDRSKMTAERLEAAGARVRHEVLPLQGHVLTVPSEALERWVRDRVVANNAF